MAERTPGPERMIFFSDAVIAIMLTLLALELPVPEAADPRHLWPALAAHGPQYLAFLGSFSVIAVTWVAHHMFFAHVSRTDPPLITLNILTLLGYAVIPWASKTLGDMPNGAGVIVYAAAMSFLGGTMYLVVRHVARAGLLDGHPPRSVVRGIRAWTAATSIMFGLSVPLALVAGRWIMLAWPVGYAGLRLVPAASKRAAADKRLVSDHETQQEDTDPADHRDDRLHHRPGFDGLAHGHPEVLLDQPEPGVVHVREEQ